MYRIFIKKNISINMCTKFRRTITMIYIVLACRLQTFPHQLHLNVTVRFNKQAFNTRCSDEVIFCIIWERINHSVRNYTGPWRRESKPQLSNCCQCHLLSNRVTAFVRCHWCTSEEDRIFLRAPTPFGGEKKETDNETSEAQKRSR